MVFLAAIAGAKKPEFLLKTLFSSLEILVTLTATTGKTKFWPGLIKSYNTLCLGAYTYFT